MTLVPGAPDVFVSYTQSDRSWAEWIGCVLEEAGFSTVLQAWDFGAGENFPARMQRASVEARRTIAVLSPDYVQSRWAEWEWAPALAQNRLLPVLVRKFDAEGQWAVAVYVDLVDVDEDVARERLLVEVKRSERTNARTKPTVKPVFPAGERARTAPPRFPGALPDTCNLPAIRNRRFQDRVDELERLSAALASKHVVALTGLDGVGKSQLAVQYAHRHAASF